MKCTLFIPLHTQISECVGHKRIARIQLKGQVEFLTDLRFDRLKSGVIKKAIGRDHPQRLPFRQAVAPATARTVQSAQQTLRIFLHQRWVEVSPSKDFLDRIHRLKAEARGAHRRDNQFVRCAFIIVGPVQRTDADRPAQMSKWRVGLAQHAFHIVQTCKHHFEAAVGILHQLLEFAQRCCQTNDCKHQINRAIEIYALNN
jgi:hypothetical protein